MQSNRRHTLKRAAALPFLVAMEGCVSPFSARTTNPSESNVYGAQEFDAFVTHPRTAEPVSAKTAPPTYSSLQAAIDAAPGNSERPWRISVGRGIYREKIELTKPNLHLIGVSRAQCVLTYDAFAGQPRPGGGGQWTTFGCATLIVRAPGFRAENLTIRNDFDYLTNDAKPPTDPTYTNDPQAVALMLAKGSDRALIQNVSINGFQDTLFVDAGRSLFRDCTVSGNVDFIFGAGQAFFDRCDIVSRPRRKPNVSPHGYVTAPSTQISERYGLVFSRCRLLRENALVPARSHALGRPWHPAANFPDGRYADPNAIGSSVFLECYMDEHIHPAGWWSMTGLQKSGPTRTVFLPEDSRFFEYRCHGPGASEPGEKKRRQLSEAQASEYVVSRVLNGWVPG